MSSSVMHPWVWRMMFDTCMLVKAALHACICEWIKVWQLHGLHELCMLCMTLNNYVHGWWVRRECGWLSATSGPDVSDLLAWQLHGQLHNRDTLSLLAAPAHLCQPRQRLTERV
jgi:hypothetical protein